MLENTQGQPFWLDRRTHLSTMRTAGSLTEAAEPYVEEFFKRNLSRIELREQELIMTFAFGTPMLMLSSGHKYIQCQEE